jgi:Ca2+-binding EF-hand superfamily protein
MRLDMRAERPPTELVEDSFNEALLQEQAVLVDVMQQLCGRQENGQSLVAPLESAKAEMHASRLTLHLDRTGSTQQLLDHVTELERDAGKFCKESQQFVQTTERRSKKALARTCATMKHRIAATVELKEQIEKDMKETRRTICEAELHLDRLERQLQVQLAMPERSAGQQGDFSNKKLAAHTGVLAELRAKIKAAAYVGASGRQLHVLFGRFDRDGSGNLDEDEVRRALRRACRIPPTVVTDAEISSLCALLDEDQSGTVSIDEITDFLCADVNVDSLEEQCSWAKESLAKLKLAQKDSQANLRNKVAAWKIDAACARVNPIKSLKLDGLPSPGRPTTSTSPRVPSLPAAPVRPNTAAQSEAGIGRPITATSTPRIWTGSQRSPRKPKAKAQGVLPALTARAEEFQPVLDPAVMETLRSRIKGAAYTGAQGRQLDVILARFDKDGSGTLTQEELKQALRRTLKIPPSLVPDADIAALCSKLDSDKSGSVSISELIEFVGSEPEGRKRTGKPTQGNGQPTPQSSQAGPPDESAGPAVRE